MKLTAWIMFESHNFLKVTGDGIEGLKKAINNAYDDDYQFGDNTKSYKGDSCIAGWGRVTFESPHFSSDDFHAFTGLHKRDEIKNISLEHLEEALEGKLKEKIKTANEYEIYIKSLNELREKMKPITSNKEISRIIKSLRRFGTLNREDAELIADVLEGKI